jgi:hypothetical protein
MKVWRKLLRQLKRPGATTLGPSGFNYKGTLTAMKIYTTTKSKTSPPLTRLAKLPTILRTVSRRTTSNYPPVERLAINAKYRSTILSATLQLLGPETVEWKRTGDYAASMPKMRAFELVEAVVTRDVPKSLYQSLKREGNEEMIWESRIVPCPNFLVNSLVCIELQKRFPLADLLACPGFVMRTFEDGDLLLLDLDPWLVRQGFLVPVFSNGLIYALKVFRHPRDERPFLLKSRREVSLNA